MDTVKNQGAFYKQANGAQRRGEARSGDFGETVTSF